MAHLRITGNINDTRNKQGQLRFEGGFFHVIVRNFIEEDEAHSVLTLLQACCWQCNLQLIAIGMKTKVLIDITMKTVVLMKSMRTSVLMKMNTTVL